MADKYYDLSGNPVYHEQIGQLKRSDPADAATIFNPLIQMLLDNTHFVKLFAEALAVRSVAELDRLRAECSSADSKLRSDTDAAIAALRKESGDADNALRQENAADHTAIRKESSDARDALKAAIEAAIAALRKESSDEDAAIRRDYAAAITAAIAAIPTPDVSGQIGTHDASAAAHQAIQTAFNNALKNHQNDKNNPHVTTATQVGALPIGGGTLTGDLRIKGSSNYGNKLNFGDGDYVHFWEWIDDCLEIKAKKVNIVVSSKDYFTVNGSKVGGGQEITLMNSVPSSLSNGQIALVYV